MAGPIPHRAAPYEEIFWGSRHHCPMEVGAYAQSHRRRRSLAAIRRPAYYESFFWTSKEVHKTSHNRAVI